MKPSRALYIICGGLICAGATVHPFTLFIAAISLIAALIFDYSEF